MVLRSRQFKRKLLQDVSHLQTYPRLLPPTSRRNDSNLRKRGNVVMQSSFNFSVHLIVAGSDQMFSATHLHSLGPHLYDIYSVPIATSNYEAQRDLKLELCKYKLRHVLHPFFLCSRFHPTSPCEGLVPFLLPHFATIAYIYLHNLHVGSNGRPTNEAGTIMRLPAFPPSTKTRAFKRPCTWRAETVTAARAGQTRETPSDWLCVTKTRTRPGN